MGAVVVSHAKPGLARDCLASISSLVAPANAVVVVNDGAVEPGELEVLRQSGSVILNDRQRGYGHNLNRGVSALSADLEYVLLLNDDLVFAPGAGEKLVAALDADAAAGIAGPCIMSPDGGAQPAAFEFPSIRSEALQAAILPARLADRLRAPYAAPAKSGPPRRVDWILGAALLVRRRAFDAVGGFDPGYFLYSEETDFCLRARARGWSVLSCGDAVVVHLGAMSTGDQRFVHMLGRSRARYIRRSFSQTRQLSLAAILFGVAGWNLLYVACRILCDPPTASAKLHLVQQHWRGRSLLQRLRQPSQQSTDWVG